MYMTRDVPIRSLHTRFAELPQRKVLGESCLLVNTYFCHNLLFFTFELQHCNAATLSFFILLSFLLFVYVDWRAFRESDAISFIEGFQVNFVEADARLDRYDSTEQFTVLTRIK